MAEIEKIQLESDYKKDDTKKVDRSKITIETKDTFKPAFKERFEATLTKNKVGPTELCTSLKTQTEAFKTENDPTKKPALTTLNETITKINASINTSFDIVPMTDADNKDLIAFKFDKTNSGEEYTLIAKEEFFGLFSEMVAEIYKDCGGLEVELSIKQDKTDEFQLTDKIFAGGKKGSDIQYIESQTKGTPGEEVATSKKREEMDTRDKLTTDPGRAIKGALTRVKDLFSGFKNAKKELADAKTEIKGLLG